MKLQPIDHFAQNLDPEVNEAIHKATSKRVVGRRDVLFGDFPEANQMRHWAGELKRHTISHLDQYLEQAANQMEANGVPEWCQEPIWEAFGVALGGILGTVAGRPKAIGYIMFRRASLFIRPTSQKIGLFALVLNGGSPKIKFQRTGPRSFHLIQELRSI